MHKLIWKFKVWTGKFFRLVLRQVFNFDQWHLYTLTERPYAMDIIRFSNSRSSRQSFVEIGCGLGDIIRHVRYKERYGFDNDRNVLKAAAFIKRITLNRGIRFEIFRFPESTLPGTHDVIVMVNWIHHIEPSVLKKKIEEYFNTSLNPGGAIIIDTVQDKEYRFNHDIHRITEGLH